MRVCTDKNDPGYDAWQLMGRRARVFLDGWEITQPFDLADEEQGFVRVAKLDSEGDFIVEGDIVLREIKVGQVRILPHGDPV